VLPVAICIISYSSRYLTDNEVQPVATCIISYSSRYLTDNEVLPVVTCICIISWFKCNCMSENEIVFYEKLYVNKQCNVLYEINITCFSQIMCILFAFHKNRPELTKPCEMDNSFRPDFY
jgi:hypothetical protein